MTKTGKVICPYCGTGCQVELHVENNVIRSALGVQDNPVNQGNLCLKGFYGWDYVGAPDRLTKPLIRKKDGVFSKDGDLEEASWDEALDLVVAKMKERNSGSARWTLEDNYVAQKIMRAVIGTNNVDHCARI